MGDGLAGPGGHKDLEGFVEHLAAHPIIELLPGLRELPGEPVGAQTNAEDEPATAEHVQTRGFPGDLGGAAARQRGDHGA